MAKVFGQKAGGEVKEYDAMTVGELREQMGVATNYSASIKGTPASADQELSDFDVVTFAPQIKGA